jgi:hypothetical protein
MTCNVHGGAGYYRVRINTVTYYPLITKETKHARRSMSNLLGRIALRVTGRRRQSLLFSVADENATPAERLKIWSDFP